MPIVFKTKYVICVLVILIVIVLFMIYLTWKSRKDLQEYGQYTKQCNMQEVLPFHVRQIELHPTPMYSYPSYPNFAPEVPSPYFNHNFRESFAPVSEIIEPLEIINEVHPQLKMTDQMDGPMIFSHNPEADYEQMSLSQQSFQGMMTSQVPKSMYYSSDNHELSTGDSSINPLD